MEEDLGNTNHLTTRNEVQESKNESDKHISKSERKKKMKKLKEENKRLKKLLKQIGGKVSNSGLLSVEQQNALAEEIKHEISCISDDNLDTDQNREVLNEKASNDVTSKSLDADENPETSFHPSNFVAGPTNLDGNNGFQFGLCKPSADVSSSVKQNIGRNYFLREVVVDPHVTDYMDMGACELNVLRRVCLRNEEFAPISPLPPTPPPKSSDSKPAEPQRTLETNHISLNHNQPKQSSEPSSSKKHSFNHQQSEGFDVPYEQPVKRTGAFTGAYDGLVPASNASHSRLGKYEFTSKRSADGGVLLTFSLSDNISVSLDSNTWEITCRIPDPKRKLPICTPFKTELPSPPHSSNVDSISNDLEVHEPVPYKKQKLSSSEESLRIVLPSMEDVELGKLGKMDEPESRGLLTQGVSNLVPRNQVSQPNILSTPSEKNDLSKQDEISPLLSPIVNHNDENQFQSVEDNRSIVSSSSESPSPAQLCTRKLRYTALSADNDISAVQGGLNSNCNVVNPKEMLNTSPNSHGLSVETSTIKNMNVVISKCPQITLGVSTSESDNSSERSSLTKYSLKKLRKRIVSFSSEENLPSPVLFEGQSTVNRTESFGNTNGYLSTSCSEPSVFKKPKRVSKKQRLTSSHSIQAVDSSACKSAKMKKREVKASRNSSKALRKQNRGSEDADCYVNAEESDFKIKRNMNSEPQTSVTKDSDSDKTKFNQINMQSPEKIGKSTAQITRQKNISISRIEDEQNLIETSLQNNIKNTEVWIKMHNENNQETITLDNELSLNQDSKLNDDCDEDALSSSFLPGTLSTVVKCENFELLKPSDVKCEILHADEAEKDNLCSKNSSEHTAKSMHQNSTHTTFKIEKSTKNSLKDPKNCVEYKFECNLNTSPIKCKSEPTSDQSDGCSDAETDRTNMFYVNNFMSPSKDINSIPSGELVSPISKIDEKLSSPQNKLSSNDLKQDNQEEKLNEMHFNQIELGSFDPDAFTKPNYTDELEKTISVSRTEMISSTPTSKNLLKDDIFSVFNSDNSLKIALRTQDEDKKESSNTEFSFLNSNPFPFDCFSLPIKKRTLPEVKQSELTCNSEGVQSSPVKTQNTGNAKCITPPKASMVENDQPLIKGDLNAVSNNSTPPDLEVGEVEIEVKTEYFKKKCIQKPVSKRLPVYYLEDINEKEINIISDSPKKVLNGSTLKGMQRSLLLNPECKNSCSEGTENESDNDHALVIADNAVDSDHATEPEVNIPEDALHFTSSACIQGSPTTNVTPKKRRGRQLGTRKNNSTTAAENGCVDTILTGIERAFKALEVMKYSDMHLKPNTHNLYSAFINPDNSLEKIVYLVVKNLSVSRRNPMLTYSLNRDSSLLPLPELCIVTALFQSSNKPRLVKLLQSVVLTIYDIVLAKQKLNIYGLCSLCRVLTEICKRNKDKKVPISLCCDLVSTQHKFAPYMVASIAGVWGDLFTVSEQSPVEDRVLYGVLALAVHNKTKPLTQSQWNHCSLILSERLNVKLQPDLQYTIEFIERMIKMKCSKGVFANTFPLTMSLVIIARIQDWQSTKELVLDSFVIPSLHKFSSEEINEKAFTLFCSLYGNICASCPYPDEPKDLLTSLFENKADTFVQEAAAIALIKLFLAKKETFPDYLETWIAQNGNNSKLECLMECFRRHLMSNTELEETDVFVCE